MSQPSPSKDEVNNQTEGQSGQQQQQQQNQQQQPENNNNNQAKSNKVEQQSAEQFEDKIRQNKAKLSENDRIKLLVVRVCEDTPKTFVLSIQKLTDQIIEYAQKPEKIEYKDVLIRYFVDSVSLSSFKPAVYATVLSLVYLKSKEIFDEILKKITDQFQKSIDKGERIKSKNILIFLGELMNIGVINCFNYRQLVNEILEHCKTLEKQEEREYYLSIVIGSLGNVQESLRRKIGHEFDQIVKEITNLMNKRDTSYIQIFKSKFNKDKDFDRLYVLWQSILRDIEKSKNNDQNQPQSQSVLGLRYTYALFQNELKNIEQPEFSFTIEFKNIDKTKCVYQSPIFVSTILKNEEEIERLREEEEQQRADEEEEEMDEEDNNDEDDEDEEGGRQHNKNKKNQKKSNNSSNSNNKKNPRKLYPITTEKLIYHENILQTYQLFRQSKKNLFQQIQMLLRVTGEESQIEKNESDFIFASFVDTLICESVRAKNGSAEDEIASRVLYYSSLANSLHALRKEESRDLVFDAFNEIYRNLSDYTCESVEYLAEFMSHIISETHLEFPWEKIIPKEASSQNNQQLNASINPSVIFCRDLINRLCQLCGREKVIQVITNSTNQQSPLLTFIPLLNKQIIKTRFQDGTQPIAKIFNDCLIAKKNDDEVFEEIEKAMKEGKIPDEFEEEGQEDEDDDEDDDEEQGNKKKSQKKQKSSNYNGISDSHKIKVMSIFLECFCFRSFETVTHLKILFNRYATVFKRLYENHGPMFSKTLIDTLLFFWENSLFNIETYLKKFISVNYITQLQVAESIFELISQIKSPSTSNRQIHQLWSFLRRITFNVADTYQNYNEEMKAQQTQTHNTDEDKTEIETLQSKLEKVQLQLTDLLQLIFDKFSAVFNDKSQDEIKEKQYDIYFLFFYRKYKKLVDWDNNYTEQFSSFNSLPLNVIQSYRI